MSFKAPTVSEYLHTSLPKFSRDALIHDPVARHGTTDSWAHSELKDMQLADAARKWDKGDEFLSFLEAIRKLDTAGQDVPVVDDVFPFEAPRTEGDVVDAVSSKLLFPIWKISRAWVPRNADGLQVHWDFVFETLTEQYTKSPAPESSFQSENVQFQSTPPSPERPKTASKKKNAIVGNSKSSDSQLPGVRVDKIMVLAFKGASESKVGAKDTMAVTRNTTKTQEKIVKATRPMQRKVASSSLYLKKSEFWGFDGCDKDDHLKVMLPIEVKRCGVVSKAADAIRRLSTEKIMLSDDKALSNLSRPDQLLSILEGTMSILRQAVRYGDHYGSDIVFLTDYLTSIVLWLPAEGQTGNLDWAIIEPGKEKLALAFSLWSALTRFKKRVEKSWKAELQKGLRL